MEPPLVSGGLAKPADNFNLPEPIIASGSPPLTSGGSLI